MRMNRCPFSVLAFAKSRCGVIARDTVWMPEAGLEFVRVAVYPASYSVVEAISGHVLNRIIRSV
jgi:hypothetical protein